MLGVLKQDYVRTARAKGLLEPRVIMKHALRNALIPVRDHRHAPVRRAARRRPVLTEQIFTIPGFGKLIVDAVFDREGLAVVQDGACCALPSDTSGGAGRRALRRAQPAPEDSA